MNGVSVYQRVDGDTGRPVAGKYEFTYRDATGRQVWQTARGAMKRTPKPSAPSCSRMHRGERVERTSLTVGEVARLWLERGVGQKGRWAPRHANATSGSSACTSTPQPSWACGRSVPASYAS